VETVEIKNLLLNLGCECIQGYLFSRPLPASEATKLLQEYQYH
jgi:EAL domain-containing protein (putative c-di-GMP-specific phosphodiesterase class I)